MKGQVNCERTDFNDWDDWIIYDEHFKDITLILKNSISEGNCHWQHLAQARSEFLSKTKGNVVLWKVNVMHDQMLIPVIHKHNILHC